MKQSDERAAARAGTPPSFGRAGQEPAREEEFRVVGGQAFMTLNVDVVPSEASLAGLYEQVKNTVAAAIRDAYADAVGEALPEPSSGVAGGMPFG